LKWWQFWWKQIASIKKTGGKKSGLFLLWLYKGRNKSGKSEDSESTSRSAKKVVALKETMKIKIIVMNKKRKKKLQSQHPRCHSKESCHHQEHQTSYEGKGTCNNPTAM
jgi:hypothetical protein